jgi:hypothetical protein
MTPIQFGKPALFVEAAAVGPQGLKPARFLALDGAAKAAPFQDNF